MPKGRPPCPPYDKKKLKDTLKSFVDKYGCKSLNFGVYSRVLEKAGVKGTELLQNIKILEALWAVSPYIMFNYIDLKEAVWDVTSRVDGIVPENQDREDFCRKCAATIQTMGSHVICWESIFCCL